MAMKLYDLCGLKPSLRFSPYCWRAKMALAHKGVDFDAIGTPFTGIGSVECKIKTVPALDDNGRIIRDSFDIAVYLDAANRDLQPLFGHDGVVAAARLIESWANATIHPLISQMIVKDVHDVLDAPDQAYFRESREARLGKSLDEAQKGVEPLAGALADALMPVRRTLAHHDFLGGAKPLYTDYIVFGSLMWLMSIHGSVPFADGDPVGTWFQRCLDLHGGYARKMEKAA